MLAPQTAASRPPPARQPVLRVLAAFLAVTLATATAPVTAHAAGDKVTPASAAEVRKAAQDRASPLLESDPGSAAELLSNEARKTLDPVLFFDAAEAYKAAGVEGRDREALTTAIEQASIGLDIAHFQQDPRCDPKWKHIDPADFNRETARGRQIIADSEEAIVELDKPVVEEPPPEEPEPETPRDGRGLIAGGALATTVGVGGVIMIGAGLAISAGAQKDVDALDPSRIDFETQLEEIDKRGKGANTVAYAGIGVAVIGLGVGIALLALGLKKRKAYRAEHGEGETARVHVAPALGLNYGGLAVGGRF